MSFPDETTPENQDVDQPVPKISKAAKRREKAAARARSLNMAVENSLATYATSEAGNEYSKLENALLERGLTLHKVIFYLILFPLVFHLF